MHSTAHASKTLTHALCLKSCILQCTLSHFIFMYWYTSNSKCEDDLFVVRASGAHELKANARANTSKCTIGLERAQGKCTLNDAMNSATVTKPSLSRTNVEAYVSLS